MSTKPLLTDPHNLARFLSAQENIYLQALREILQGQKQNHWMWFVFPQIAGLGRSDTARHYAIASLAEAKSYLEHPVLGKRLGDISHTLLSHDSKTATQIFDHPDDMKLKSSMTLFKKASGEANSVFKQVLDKYFNGEEDDATLQILNRNAG